jgi:hypothetical protein
MQVDSEETFSGLSLRVEGRRKEGAKACFWEDPGNDAGAWSWESAGAQGRSAGVQVGAEETATGGRR